MEYIAIWNGIYYYMEWNILLYGMEYIAIWNGNVLLYGMEYIAIWNGIFCYMEWNIFIDIDLLGRTLIDVN